MSGMAKLGEMSKVSRRDLAVRSVSEFRMAALIPVALPHRPSGVTDTLEDKFRKEGNPGGGQSELWVTWHEWLLARSSGLTDNLSRLRGALSMLAALRAVAAADPSDLVARECGVELRAMLREVWGIHDDIPDGFAARSEVARKRIDQLARGRR